MIGEIRVSYVGECAHSRSVGRPRKRWIDTVEDCLRNQGLDVRQERSMVHEGERIGQLLTLRCNSCGLPQLYETFEEWKSVCLWLSLQLKGENFFFSFAAFLLLLISWRDTCRPWGGGRWLCIINK